MCVHLLWNPLYLPPLPFQFPLPPAAQTRHRGDRQSERGGKKCKLCPGPGPNPRAYCLTLSVAPVSADTPPPPGLPPRPPTLPAPALARCSASRLCSPGLPGLAFSRPKNDKFGLFCIDWPRIFFIYLLSIWPFFKVYRSLYSKIKTFSGFKTEFGIFQLQAPGNSGAAVYTGSSRAQQLTPHPPPSCVCVCVHSGRLSRLCRARRW